MRVRFSLKAKFVLILISAFFVGGFFIYTYSTKRLKNFVIQSTAEDFAVEVQKDAEEVYNLNIPASLALGGKQKDFYQKLSKIHGASNIEIFDTNGTVVFSENNTRVGQSNLDSADLIKALNGSSFGSNIDEQNIKGTFFTPITSNNNDIRGAVSATKNLNSSFLFINSFIFNFMLALGGISSFFMALSYFLLANTENSLLEQGRSIVDKSKALEEEQQLDEAIMSSVGEALIVINKSGQILLFNPEAEKLMGYKSADIEFRAYDKIIQFKDKEGKASERNPIAEGLKHGKRTSIAINDNVFIKNSKKELVPVSVNVAAIEGDNENIRGVVLTIHDVTAEKELGKVKDEFVYVVAHELGNPIFALDGYVSILNERLKRADKQTKNMIESIRGINQQLSNLVNELLEVSRNENNQLSFEVVPINLTDIIDRVIENSSFKAKQKNIKINYKKSKILKVFGDEQKIREVLTNFIDNAIKYTPEGGEVSVSDVIDDGFVITHVKDNGFGISKEAQKHLFEKFYRVKNDKTKGINGTGLGLFITKQIVEKCSGEVWATSEEGKGSTFSFKLKKA